LLDLAGESFDAGKVGKGELTPVFFGSAMTNFGVEVFLEEFLRLSPAPGTRLLKNGLPVTPRDPSFSAFVFKIQANMNPAHRDRIAFFRVCSGVFKKGMAVCHAQSGKTVKLTQPQQFLAKEREMVEEAYPGDILGIFEPGLLGIGDTLCEVGEDRQFVDFPIFPPEMFTRIQPKDTLKRKQFVKGIEQLGQEGAVQIFRQPGSGTEACVAGAVGALQIDVLSYRLRYEYGVELLLNNLPYTLARWVAGDEAALTAIKGLDNGLIVLDRKDRPVLLLSSLWSLNWLKERNPGLLFLEGPDT
jgi:peptide chain release factor 3